MKIFVEQIRLKKKLTLSELSRRSGVAVSHIHGIEAGTRIPSITVICKLSKGLDVSPYDLFSCEN